MTITSTSRERFAGSVLGTGTLVHDATLMVGGERSNERSIPCSFDLRTDDGSTRRVTVSESSVLGPRTVLKGEWSEVSNHRLAALYASAAPGDHVNVKLSGVVIAAGDVVAVEGRVVPGKEPGAPSIVEAHFIGVGDDAMRWVGERVERAEAERAKQIAERSGSGGELAAWPAIPIAVAGLAAIIHGELIGPAIEAPQVFAVRAYQVSGLFFVTLALFLWRRRHFTLRMLEATPRQSADVLWALHPWATFLIGIGLPISFVLAATSLEDNPIGAASYLGALFVTATLWGVILVETRADARSLRTIVATRPIDGDGWGRRLGTVVEGKLQRQRTHQKTSTTTRGSAYVRDAVTDALQTVETSSTVSFYKALESSGSGKLDVQIGDRTVAVDVFGNARWGTTRRSIAKLTLTESLLPGDQVLLVGRIQDATMRGAGPESLFVLGSHHGDAADVAARELRTHWIAMACFASVTVAEIYFLFTH